MPSTLTIPTIDDHVAAAEDALRGERDRYGDKHAGSIYSHIYGPTAVLFAREAEWDRDLFQDIYVDDAQGDALTTRLETLYRILRIRDTYGLGSCIFGRASSAGADTIWEGTRIRVSGSPPGIYVVANDTPVPATTLNLPVPIRATVLGSGTAANITDAGALALLDPLADPLWKPMALTCADGTDFEKANDYRARVRRQRIASRNGYITEMVASCQAAGATYVVGFKSDYGLDPITDSGFDDDFGLNAIYVADSNYQSTPQLVNACAVALESTRVCGPDLWVGGISHSRLIVAATVTLTDDPGKLPILTIQRSLVQALVSEFSGTQDGYIYKLTGLRGAMTQASPFVQGVALSLPTVEPVLTPTAWPATLTRWTLAPRDVVLTFAAPT